MKIIVANIENMKKKLLILSLILCTTVAHAEFKTKAKSAFLIDYDSGTEIVAKNADEEHRAKFHQFSEADFGCRLGSLFRLFP